MYSAGVGGGGGVEQYEASRSSSKQLEAVEAVEAAALSPPLYGHGSCAMLLPWQWKECMWNNKKRPRP